MKDNIQHYRCDFCQKKTGYEGNEEPDAGIMIKAGNDACICEDCIDECNELIKDLKNENIHSKTQQN